MEVGGAVAVVAGGAGPVGAALCRALAARGANVVVADRDGGAARDVAGSLPGDAIGVTLDVTDEHDVGWLVPFVEQRLGPVDVYCSSATAVHGSGLGADDAWGASWRLDVMAHVYAARAVLVTMARRRYGYFLVTASADGLLSDLDSAPHAVSQHAAVALAEWLAVQYAGSGVSISCLCPDGNRTPPDAVAEAALAGLSDGRFLVLPRPELAGQERHRVEDRDGWIARMARTRDVSRGPADGRDEPQST